MQHIDIFKWLTDVLQHLGGSPLQVVITEHQQFKKMTISFEIPSKQYVGTMIPIVASGKESLVKLTFELRQILPRNQCSPPTAKYFLVEVKQRTAHLSVH